ncbi:MAG: glycosyltransferase family 4 protein [Bacteroidales bacterium]|nr:glycosyltransferase family 4 protein [Bacteroidales bacterium]
MWIYILAACLLLVTELVYFKVAEHFNIIDRPNKRSSHKRITLRGGGIIFYFGVLNYFLLYGFVYPWLFAGLTLIAIISFADDNRPQSSKLRLTVHFVAIFLMFFQLGLFYMPWYFTLLALIFCTGVLNAFNFMDGINGMTGGYSMVVIGSLWYINTYQVSFVDNNLIYILLLALCIFNIFNFRIKAICFSGDVGAFSIAFVILFMLVSLILKAKDVSYIILLGLYGVDTILTIIHRIMLKDNIFKPHRKHMYQLMANEMKMPHVLVSGIYCFVQALISVGLIWTESKYWYMLAVILLFSTIYILFMRKYFKLQSLHHVK